MTLPKSLENLKFKTRIARLAGKLIAEVDKLASEANILIATRVCRRSDTLYCAFEKETVWANAVTESNRLATLEALELAKSAIDRVSQQINPEDLSTYIRIQVEMARRIEIVRYSTIDTFKDRMNEVVRLYTARKDGKT